MADILRYGKCE